MIQDIFPKKMNNQYEPKQPAAEDVVFCFYDGRILFAGDYGHLRFPQRQQLESYYRDLREEQVFKYRYLFSIDEQSFFLLENNIEIRLPGYSYDKMFQIRSYEPKELVFAASTAWHLYVWYRDNRFCGRCASKLVHDEKERMLRCPVCGNMVFPKIAPAIITGVVHGDKLLMTKYANRDYKRYALIAGFTEIGETPEQTVAREVFEEAGVHVKNVRYYKCQPWGFDSNLLLGYFAELDGEESITMDADELSLAEWVSRENIEVEEDDRVHLSLTHEMMMLFRDADLYHAFLNNADAASLTPEK